MKRLNFCFVVFSLIFLLNVQALAQKTRERTVNPCPKSGGTVWIELKDRKQPLDGQFLEIDESEKRIYYCEGKYRESQPLDNVVSISFDSKSVKNSQAEGKQDAIKPEAEDAPVFPASADVQVEIIAKPQPGYTIQAVEKGLSGKVVLRVVFNKNGFVEDIQTVETPDPVLSEIASEAAKKIQFKPAMKGNKPVSVRQLVEYQFTANKQNPTGTGQVVILISPKSHHEYKRTERRVDAEWTAVQGASFYRFQVQYASMASMDWYSLKDVIVQSTKYQFDYDSPYPGRWRVWAVKADGTLSAVSEWRHFAFTK